jgi:hypothetical protein
MEKVLLITIFRIRKSPIYINKVFHVVVIIKIAVNTDKIVHIIQVKPGLYHLDMEIRGLLQLKDSDY